MVRTVIIDDDQLARKILYRIINQNFEELEIVGEAGSVSEGLKLINEADPDLVFLDIEMPDGTGFDLIDQLTEVDFRLVFVTSYNDYAITAFKYSAFDYILKPVLPENVKSTITRILKSSGIKPKIEYTNLRSQIERTEDPNDVTIALPEMNGFAIIKVKNILRCEGERNYTRVFYKDGTSVLISRTLLEFDQLLVPHGFFRIHRSHLVNLTCINRYVKTDGGMVEMTDKSQLKVSPKFKDELLDLLLHNKL
ncbi:LytR/AlgR family response regulator transcription factor [Mangrovibacterium diazotrophicum]|uniref:LytTR family two component transcriptional regulator n=1 Tax=Mangrovibacterium diazotrophicum TaxID=1261403 RepID=A0A419W8Q5_9BACT|nr:LytTR family DNA-binding domain-containing protein [Mangrovibacterium diazotrophicum]RKD91857.1 LytTR family two component transcriptional regulator [Mangrovibacterium diazotrophicum]